MCSLSRQDIMDTDQSAGDLTDVVRARASSGFNIVSLSSTSATYWPGEFASISQDNNVATVRDDFGKPFSNTGDPLLRNGTVLATAAHHDRSKSPAFGPPFVDREENWNNDDGRIGHASSRGCVSSRLLQITTCEHSPLAAEGVPPLGGVKCNDDCNYINGPVLPASTVTVDCGAVGMMQISSSRNPGMKRRKIEAKKVVCIPAPAPANRRPSSGEVVPSDLWAWRKYGQKPIKGSPHPRGYYKCSSSKGCSARKQVERSRTDPNMLVITYTSEHNHPWPTQRNSLTGSTRSISKAGSISENSGNNNNSHPAKPKVAKGEEQAGNSSDDNASSTAAVAGVSSGAAASVKEEMEKEVEEKQIDMEDVEFIADGLAHCYRPTMVDGLDRHPDDYFADLGELDADPYELLFDQGFTGNHRNQGNKSLDAFNLLDWADEDDGTSFGEAIKKGL